jgi:superfamily I DNA/RNA helicase
MLENGTLSYNTPFDFFLMDEIGDITAVSLAIFQLVPARFKVGCGDKMQEIYSFNHTINGFEVLKHSSTQFPMTQSFRVSASIATRVESFLRDNIDPNAEFKGTKLTDTAIRSKAILTRTNAALIDYMITLEDDGTPFSLVRKATDIFKLPLLVTSFKNKGTITDSQYRHVQDDINYYYDTVLPAESKAGTPRSLFGYLLDTHRHDYPLVQAIKLVSKRGAPAILKAYNHAREYENGSKHKQPLILASIHSVKGLEMDEVTIGNDANSMVEEILSNRRDNPDYQFTEDELTELRLYYVACTRARVKLNNAACLDL